METSRAALYRNVAVVLVVVSIAAAGAFFVTSGLGNQHSSTTPSSSKQCSTASVHVDGNFTIGSGYSLYFAGIAYDPQNDLLYVSSPETRSIYAVNPNNGSVIANMTGAGISPGDLAYDPANGYIYIVNGASNSVSVLDTSTRTFVANITVGEGPNRIIYDPANSEIYVSIIGKVGSNTIAGAGVVAISSSSNSVVANISSGPYPAQMAYDAKNGYIYITHEVGNTTIIDGTSNTLVGIVFIPDYRYVASR